MKKSYQIGDRRDSKALAEFLAKKGPLLLPMLELIEVMGRATNESAEREILEAVRKLAPCQCFPHTAVDRRVQADL